MVVIEVVVVIEVEADGADAVVVVGAVEGADAVVVVGAVVVVIEVGAGAAPLQAANRTASTTADHRGKWVTLQSWRISMTRLRRMGVGA